jgi:hypothetical protein
LSEKTGQENHFLPCSGERKNYGSKGGGEAKIIEGEEEVPDAQIHSDLSDGAAGSDLPVYQ